MDIVCKTVRCIMKKSQEQTGRGSHCIADHYVAVWYMEIFYERLKYLEVPKTFHRIVQLFQHMSGDIILASVLLELMHYCNK